MMSCDEYTDDEVDLARRIWKARNALDLNDHDRERGLKLGFIIWPYASNLCNDVRSGHRIKR